MDKLTAIKIKYDDGTYSDEIPVSVLSENVEWDSTHTLVDVLGSIDVDVTGTIQDQISQLFNEKVSTSAMQDYVTNSMPTYITNWLNTNVNPVGSAVVVDSSLTVSGAAADAKVTGDIVIDKNYIKNEIFSLNGNYVFEWERLQRMVENGKETWHNSTAWISQKRGTYFNFKQGDIIFLITTIGYSFRIMLSIDDGTTWTMSSAQSSQYTIPNDGIGWIALIKTNGTATDEDIKTINNNHIVHIKRENTNLINESLSLIQGLFDINELDVNTGYNVESIHNNIINVWVIQNSADTSVSNNENLLNKELPCVKGEFFRFKFNVEALLYPENYNDYYVIVRELDTNGTVRRNVQKNLSEGNIIDFVVYYANSVKIIANLGLKRNSNILSAGYYEKASYNITALKIINNMNDYYTEAGEQWEV